MLGMSAWGVGGVKEVVVMATMMMMAVQGVASARVSPAEWAGGLTEYGYPPDSAPGPIITDSYTTANLNYSYTDAITGQIHFNFSADEGKYGEGLVSDVSGILIHVANSSLKDDHSGCSPPFTGTTQIPLNGTPWIALIKRGSCNFDLKVQNAYNKKAAGVLIYNDRSSINLDKMKLSKRNISSVFTFKHKGEELVRLLEQGYEVHLTIKKSNHCPRPIPNMNRTSVLFVAISFIVLLIMSISWLIFYYIQRMRYIYAKDKLSMRLCCAAKKALSKIPVKNLKSDDKEIQGDGECCAVCIDPYKVSDVLRILPCKHDFHKSCIDPWLLEHRTCPMCKMDILKYYGFVFTGSQESILQLDAEEGERRNNGASSPLPRQPSRTSSYDAPQSERSSRASSPDELTPSLHQSVQPSVHHTEASSQYAKYPPASGATVAVHGSPGTSKAPVDTAVISTDHLNDSNRKDAV